MVTDTSKESAFAELEKLLEENPELLKELDSDLIQLCKEMEVI